MPVYSYVCGMGVARECVYIHRECVRVSFVVPYPGWVVRSET
jgi:hypothetical protein